MATAIEPLALTAFYCCALRARDAARPHPVCGDSFAARFIDDTVLAPLERALRFRGPAASNVARHRIIDDIIRAALTEKPAAPTKGHAPLTESRTANTAPSPGRTHIATRRIILLGAGLDTRAFRIEGGQWWELDDPALLAFKESKLPAHTAPNPLVRTPVDFSRTELRDHLTPLAGSDEAIVVLEGVSMYLSTAALRSTVSAVRAALPRARIVCDLMSPTFRDRFSRSLRAALSKLGAHFANEATHPRLVFESENYRATDITSIVGRAREAGTLRIPRWLLNTFLRELRDGYAIYTFEPKSTP